MQGPWFIEILARSGDVLHRHQAPALPIRLGRAYDNDVILDDPFIAPRHALVEQDEQGQLLLRDLDSRNGVIHHGRRVASVALDGRTVVRLGHTSLRVRSADFAVAAEEIDRTRHGWEGALPGLIGVALIALATLFAVWLSDTQAFALRRYLQPLAFTLSAGLVWAGAWAFANRLFGRLARLGRHLFIAGSAVMAVTLYKLVAGMLGFAFSLEPLVTYASHITVAAAAAAVYFHLKTINPQQGRRIAAICVALALTGSSLSMLSNDQQHGRLADALYMPVIMPPQLRVSPDHQVDDFMRQVERLRPQLDVERTREVKDDGS